MALRHRRGQTGNPLRGGQAKKSIQLDNVLRGAASAGEGGEDEQRCDACRFAAKKVTKLCPDDEASYILILRNSCRNGMVGVCLTDVREQICCHYPAALLELLQIVCNGDECGADDGDLKVDKEEAEGESAGGLARVCAIWPGRTRMPYPDVTTCNRHPLR